MAAAFDWLSRQGLTQEEMANLSAALIKDLDNLRADGYWGLPVTELPVLNRHGIPVMVDLDLATDVEATQHMRIAGSIRRW